MSLDIFKAKKKIAHKNNSKNEASGFPSPAKDFLCKTLSLDEKLIKNKEATFYAKVNNDSMINAGIEKGDIVIIDRNLIPRSNHIAVCFLNDKFILRKLIIDKEDLQLKTGNKNSPNIKITDTDIFKIWGMVTYVIKKIS